MIKLDEDWDTVKTTIEHTAEKRGRDGTDLTLTVATVHAAIIDCFRAARKHGRKPGTIRIVVSLDAGEMLDG